MGRRGENMHEILIHYNEELLLSSTLFIETGSNLGISIHYYARNNKLRRSDLEHIALFVFECDVKWLNVRNGLFIANRG